MKIISKGLGYYAEVIQNRSNLPYLLLLHGFMGSGRVFEPLFETLSDFCNPVILDLAGHGRSTGTDNPARYSTKEQLSDLQSILSRFQFSPLLIYGYSMGGRLALQFAVHHPQQMDALILESTGYGISEAEERSKRQELDEERAAAIKGNFSDFLKAWQNMPLFRSAERNEHNNALYREVMQKQNPVSLAASLRGFGSGVMPSVFESLGSLKLPVLLIAGKEDHKFVSIHHQMKKEIPGAVSAVIDGAAHRVHADQPEQLLNNIEHFIKNLNR